MKTIKVFIVSSEELRLERLEIADMIQHLNRILKPRGVEIDPQDNHEEYQRELKNCEICLVLYWTKFEDQTKGELDTAYSELCAGRNPQKLYVYFKDANDITPELKAFKESFATTYGHFFRRFENVDTMKLNFLLQFEDYQNKTSEGWLKVRDSRVEIDGEPFVELKNVPFAGNNPEYLQLLKQIESTQARVLKYPDDREFRQELHDLQERRKAMEISLLDTAKLITRLSSTVSSARLAEAMRLFEAGDNKGANAILNLDEISHDADANAARIDAAREIVAESVKALESNIEEYQMKIKTLQNTMEKGWVNEVIAVYDKAVSVACDRIASEKFAKLLRDYADFLLKNKQYHLVGTLYDEALSIYRRLAEKSPETYDSYVAITLNNLALLHFHTQRFDSAEQKYREALDIYRSLTKKNPEIYEYNVVNTLNNIATLHKVTQHFDTAEQEYNEALEIGRRLAEKKSEVYKGSVAGILDNLAVLHQETQQYILSEQESCEALNIYRYLVQKNPEIYEGDMAATLNNLANLHYQTQHFDKAEKECREALEVYRRLVNKSSEMYERDVAKILNNLGGIHQKSLQFDLSVQECSEALVIYRRLADKNSEVYESDVATSLHNLAGLHQNTLRLDLSEREYYEALDIRRRLSNKKPEMYERVVADTLHDLAVLHYKIQRFDLSEREYYEALDIRRRLANEKPEMYERVVADTLHDLAVLHYKIQRFDLSEQEYRESLFLYRRLADKEPEMYESNIAKTLNNLAFLHYKARRFDLSEQEYRESLLFYRRLADKNPKTYEKKVAEILHNLEFLHQKFQRLDLFESGNYCKKSVVKFLRQIFEWFIRLISKR